MHILRILCYNGSLVTSMVVNLTTAKFKPLVFSMSDIALSHTANMFMLLILYDFSDYVEYWLQHLFWFLPEEICHGVLTQCITHNYIS
jgi:hypothetical protein